MSRQGQQNKSNDHYTNLGLASAKFIQCQTLFQAIIATANSDRPDSLKLSQVESIADIGEEKSGYWCEQFDAYRDSLGEHLGALGGAK